MTPEEFGQFLDQVGNRIGPAGAHVFDIAVRQVIAYNLMIAIFVGVWLILSLLAFKKFYSLFRKYSTTRDEYRKEHPNAYNSDIPFEEQMIISAGGIIFAICGLALTSYVVAASLVPLLNPEYTAIMDILNHLPH